ncbi:efflux RND transporter periplasmic adaptor subunit [Trinickia dinghuensis]|uniref:Efflux RND transporter periplasmic adaptor subunit n=1 Tax=Trinickia dinghuensis TaxID=2291023 RepID=A0A3D8JWY4_9BURK|nr:efflux RND transporter periplasmic adaptor subunit [Trinickia dinghuensis]RDU97312.1 efflux RND transporter periplasmic adaptor subunit [Trinickia dinghuensis]
MMNRFILAAAVLAAWSGYACAGTDAGAPSVLVTQTALRQGSLPKTVQAYGVVQASASASRTVAASTSSVVQAIYVREGEEVAAGAPLLQLMPSPETAAAYSQARSAFTVAQQLAARTQTMFAQHLSTAQQLADAQKAESDAQANLTALKTQGAGGAQVLRAPFRAVVLHLSATQGTLASAGTSLLELASPEKAVLKVGVVPAQAMLVGSGNAASVAAVGEDQRWPGTVVQRGSMINPSTGLVPIEIALPPGHFMPGEAADATIAVGQTQGYVVPHAAILVNDHGGTYVVQDDALKARKVEVSVAGSHADEDVIRGDGLNPKQPLVLSGNYQLDDGMLMRVAAQGAQSGKGEK